MPRADQEDTGSAHAEHAALGEVAGVQDDRAAAAAAAAAQPVERRQLAAAPQIQAGADRLPPARPTARRVRHQESGRLVVLELVFGGRRHGGGEESDELRLQHGERLLQRGGGAERKRAATVGWPSSGECAVAGRHAGCGRLPTAPPRQLDRLDIRRRRGAARARLSAPADEGAPPAAADGAQGGRHVPQAGLAVRLRHRVRYREDREADQQRTHLRLLQSTFLARRQR